MRAVRNDVPSKDSARALAHRVYPLVGRLTREGRAMLVDRLDQVAPLETSLRARRDAAPAGEKFGSVESPTISAPAPAPAPGTDWPKLAFQMS
jgi:hypothetical protein